MNDSAEGTALSDRFLRCVQASHDVHSRQQLFLWTRLHLHRFVPHELLAVLRVAPEQAGAMTEVLHSVPLPPALLRCLADPHHLVWHRLTQAWQAHGEQPLRLPHEALGEPELAQGLRDAGLPHLLVHGSTQAEVGGARSWVLLAQPATCAPEASQWLRWSWPLLVYAAARAQAGNPAVQRAHVLSVRECAVLRAVRAGQSNLAIGEQLGISALTVKNHLSRIMRKLGASTRGQAVAEAMARRLID